MNKISLPEARKKLAEMRMQNAYTITVFNGNASHLTKMMYLSEAITSAESLLREQYRIRDNDQLAINYYNPVNKSLVYKEGISKEDEDTISNLFKIAKHHFNEVNEVIKQLEENIYLEIE